MKRSFWVIILVFFTLGCSDTMSKIERCTSNEECVNPKRPICEIGICVALEVESECQSNTECTDELKPICQNGVCVTESVEAECLSDIDCENEAKPVCNEGLCVAKQDSFGCDTNEDCTDEHQFICKEGKCMDPSEGFTPENYRIILKSMDESYTQAELEDLKQRVEYGFLKHIGKNQSTFSFGTNFKPSHENTLRMPVLTTDAGVRYLFRIDFRDSRYDMPSEKKEQRVKNSKEREEVSRKVFNESQEKDIISANYPDGSTLTFNYFAQSQSHEPRIAVDLSINYTQQEEDAFIHYGIFKKNSHSNPGYSTNPKRLGYYDFQNFSFDILDIIVPQDGIGSRQIHRNGIDDYDLDGPKDRGVTYYFVAFKSGFIDNEATLATLAPNIPVVVKQFTSIYEESRFEDFKKPKIISFTSPELVKEPSIDVQVEIPESMRQKENLYLQWANRVSTFVPGGDYSYYPSDRYLKRWRYYHSNTSRGEKDVTEQSQVTLHLPSPKVNGENTHLIFWFSEGTQAQTGKVGEEEQMHTRIEKKAYITRYDDGTLQALPPTFREVMEPYVTPDQFKKDGELFIEVNYVVPEGLPEEEFKRNTLSWNPAAPDGSRAATENGSDSIFGNFLYATYPLMVQANGENLEADWSGVPTLSGMPEYFHPQIDYTFTSTNELMNGSMASAEKVFNVNYKSCDKGRDLKIPAMEFFPDITPFDKENKHIDLAWTNPADLDIYEIRISWQEIHPNPNIEPKQGEMIIQRFYNFNAETGELIYGEEPSGSIIGGEWSPEVSFPDVTVY